jgi:hypothetical protein
MGRKLLPRISRKASNCASESSAGSCSTIHVTIGLQDADGVELHHEALVGHGVLGQRVKVELKQIEHLTIEGQRAAFLEG